MKAIACVVLMAVATLSFAAQRSQFFRVVSTHPTHITSISADGTIVWSNSVSNATCMVEWSPLADGIWITNDLPGPVHWPGMVGEITLPDVFLTGTPSTVVSRRFTETISPVGPPTQLDIDGDAHIDLTFSRTALGTDDIPQSAWDEYVEVRGSEIILAPQDAGILIGPPSTNANSFSSYRYGVWLTHYGWRIESGMYPWQPPWGTVTNGYLGVRLRIDGKQHYGWVNIDFVDVLIGGTTNQYWPSCRVRGCAYETVPGKGIIAGAER
jgi:hypothetical protein